MALSCVSPLFTVSCCNVSVYGVVAGWLWLHVLYLGWHKRAGLAVILDEFHGQGIIYRVTGRLAFSLRRCAVLCFHLYWFRGLVIRE